MGCNSISEDTYEFEKIDKAYKSLIKSVELEI